ncbi:PqqD family protein [Rossellomorea sp. NS-SX7]|uniref:PqqD family protein n=1 Tax=Rossellomorea sp. NS-SX7 TaxID=3463856 RepID=UPI00405967AD
MVPTQNMFARFSAINGTSYLALNYDLFELNDVGQVIWESIDGQRDIEGISKVVALNYNTDVDVVENDVQEFVNVLIERGLAEV